MTFGKTRVGTRGRGVRAPTLAFLLAAASVLAVPASARESLVTISLATNQFVAAVAPDFSGLSFEVSLVLPNENGVHYFRPDNQPLLNLFHTLGIKSLRIGGNTSDRDVKRLPNEEDLDSLFAFAKAARVKVIYCLRLHGGDPQADAATAKYIMTRYSAEMDCFSIGQEPSAYPKIKKATRANEGMGTEFEKYPYASYAAEWRKFAQAIIEAAPEARFCGPSVHNNGQWARSFIEDFGQGHHVALITEHLYPGGAGGKVPTPEIGRARMLSEDFVRADQKLYDGFAPEAAAKGLPYRLEEVNNYFNGGATNVSNTFAAALWGLDFMHWWAAHGAAGVNFHTGDRVAAGATLRPSRYTAFFSTPQGFEVRPLGYGIRAFDLGGHGRPAPAALANPDHRNVSVWAVWCDDERLYLTFLNKENGANASAVEMTLAPGLEKFRHGEIIHLQAPGNDIGAATGVTLGGAEIRNDGTWSGKWTPLECEGGLHLVIPAASAAIVRLSRN